MLRLSCILSLLDACSGLLVSATTANSFEDVPVPLGNILTLLP